MCSEKCFQSPLRIPSAWRWGFLQRNRKRENRTWLDRLSLLWFEPEKCFLLSFWFSRGLSSPSSASHSALCAQLSPRHWVGWGQIAEGVPSWGSYFISITRLGSWEWHSLVICLQLNLAASHYFLNLTIGGFLKLKNNNNKNPALPIYLSLNTCLSGAIMINSNSRTHSFPKQQRLVYYVVFSRLIKIQLSTKLT